MEGTRIDELYVDSFFEKEGIGGKLVDFAVEKLDAYWLFVLEKNVNAIRFYEAHGFQLTGEREPEPGTAEYIVKMKLRPGFRESFGGNSSD